MLGIQIWEVGDTWELHMGPIFEGMKGDFHLCFRTNKAVATSEDLGVLINLSNWYVRNWDVKLLERI